MKLKKSAKKIVKIFVDLEEMKRAGYVLKPISKRRRKKSRKKPEGAVFV